eukprot:843539-Rhodomonas_salina.2
MPALSTMMPAKASMARRQCLISASATNFMFTHEEKPKGSKPWSPGKVPSSEAGRGKRGITDTPLPWILPSFQSCMVGALLAAAPAMSNLTFSPPSSVMLRVPKRKAGLGSVRQRPSTATAIRSTTHNSRPTLLALPNAQQTSCKHLVDLLRVTTPLANHALSTLWCTTDATRSLAMDSNIILNSDPAGQGRPSGTAKAGGRLTGGSAREDGRGGESGGGRQAGTGGDGAEHDGGL